MSKTLRAMALVAACLCVRTILRAQATGPVGYENVTVSTLPTPSAWTHKYVNITDGVTACDVSTGGGSIGVLAQSNGTSWVAANCGGGGGLNGPRKNTASTDAIVSADNGKNVIEAYVSGGVAITVPQAGSSGFTGSWTTFLTNGSAGNAIYTPTTSTICGASSLSLPIGQGISIWSDGTNWQCNGTVVVADGTTMVATPSGGVLSLSTGPAIATAQGVQYATYSTVTLTSTNTPTFIGTQAAGTGGVLANGAILNFVSNVTAGITGVPTISLVPGGSPSYSIYAPCSNTAAPGLSYFPAITGSTIAGPTAIQYNGTGGFFNVIGPCSAGSTSSPPVYYPTVINNGSTLTLVGPYQYFAGTNQLTRNSVPGSKLTTSGGTTLTWQGVVPPQGTGNLSVQAYWTLDTNTSGTGTGTHSYQAYCFSPGTTAVTSTPSFIGSAVAKTFSFSGSQYTIGQLDVVTGITTTGCTAGQQIWIEMVRSSTGGSPAVDASIVFGLTIGW